MSTAPVAGAGDAARAERGFGVGVDVAAAGGSTGPPMMPARSPIALLVGTLQHLRGDGRII